MSYATKEQLQELAAYMASQINVPTIGIGGGYAPVGTIISFMGTTAPQDYLACDGSTKNIADYPQLAAFFESQFGSKSYFGGNGTTTFAVPDLRGEFLRGTGTNGHANQGSGAAVGVHQDATIIPNFNANPSDNATNNLYVSGKKGAYNKVRNADKINTISSDYQDISINKSSAIDRTGDQNFNFTSRPTNTSLLLCIKATSVNENMDTTGSVYITKPNTWTPGVEYDFGNGVYGQRKTGTITGEASTTLEVVITADENIMLNVINSGGWFCRGEYLNSTPAKTEIGSVLYSSAGILLGHSAVLMAKYTTSVGNRNRIRVAMWSNIARNAAPYDVWFLYTKEAEV